MNVKTREILFALEIKQYMVKEKLIKFHYPRTAIIFKGIKRSSEKLSTQSNLDEVIKEKNNFYEKSALEIVTPQSFYIHSLKENNFDWEKILLHFFQPKYSM